MGKYMKKKDTMTHEIEHPFTHLVRPYHVVVEMPRPRVNYHDPRIPIKHNQGRYKQPLRRVIFDIHLLDMFGNNCQKFDNYHQGEDLYLHQTKTGTFRWHMVRERADTYRSWQILPSNDVYMNEFELMEAIENPVKLPRANIHTMEDDKQFEDTVRYVLGSADVPILAIREIQQIVFSFM